jgi:hypothetical protein
MKTRIRRAVVALSIVGAAVVGVASVAAADTPDRGSFVNHVPPFPWFDCSTLISGAGVIFAEGTSTIDWVDYFHDGAWVREAVHQHTEAVLHGRRGDVPYEMVANRTFDDSPIATITGRVTYHLPGQTAPLVEAGRAVLDLDAHLAISLTPHRENTQAICAAIG